MSGQIVIKNCVRCQNCQRRIEEEELLRAVDNYAFYYQLILKKMEDAKRIKLSDDNDHVMLYPVLSDDLLEDTPLVEAYVDTITNPRNISKVIVELNSVLPLPELMHLKRVKGREVLLFPVNDIEKSKVFSILEEKKFDTSMLENNVQTIKVAKIPPKVRKQYEVVQKLWPCNFHGNKYLEKLSTNTLFSQKELLQHSDFMKVAIDVAKYAKENYFNDPQIGCVVVDPKINSVVAVGYRRTNEGPCRHAAMLAVDNVARTQNGGAWNIDHTTTQTGDLNLSGIPEALLTFLKEKHQAIHFGATWFKGKTELEQPSDGPYLCTGYYVYLTHEPCIMCAMGLIHSRVKRVFFGATSSNGGLKTLCKIHAIKDLNHHYEVFGGLLESSCLELSA